MELATILHVVLPCVAFGALVIGGASSTLARIFRVRRRPFRMGRGHTAAASRVALVRREPSRRGRPPLAAHRTA